MKNSTKYYSYRTGETGLIIRPRLPAIDGIFDLGPDVLIASMKPHDRIPEHLHDHLHHMHIRYGFEIPRQDFSGIDRVALLVVMMIPVDQRVDCNPIFVARGEGSEGVCLKIAGEDVHWVHDDDAGKRGTELFESTVPWPTLRPLSLSTRPVTRTGEGPILMIPTKATSSSGADGSKQWSDGSVFHY